MKVLVIGGNSFIAKGIEPLLASEGIQLVRIGKELLDISNEDQIVRFSEKQPENCFDAILFAQGINPSQNTKESKELHVVNMLKSNVVGPILLMKHLHQKLNPFTSVIFLSSIAAEKGSYDPAYAASKAAMKGLIHSFANEFPSMRFNAISLGLVEESPVFQQMTPDFLQKHRDHMHNGQLIQLAQIASVIQLLLCNDNLNRSIIPLNAGYR